MSLATAADSRTYEVRELDTAFEQRWDTFVEKTPGGTFFHLSPWRKIIERTLGHKTWYLYCLRGDDIVAILPLAQVKSLLFGNALISLPFLVYGGPVSTDSDAEALLVDAAKDIGDRHGVDYLELRNVTRSSRDWPVKDIYATFSKQLSPQPEDNLGAIPRKQRAMIRKGIKAGLSAEQDADVGRLYQALLECKRNLGTPFFGKRYLQDVFDAFGEKVEVLTVVRKGQTICSVMSFRFRDQILPYYGGGGDLGRVYKGNDYMYWAVMEKACQEGVQVFDYGRSMIGSGAYRFKKHWGFEPQPLQYECLPIGKEEMPNLNPSNPRYQLLIKTWKRLPANVAGILGPPIARRLG